MIDPHAIREILENDSFKEALASLRTAATKKVIHPDTTPEERDTELAVIWALDRMDGRLRTLSRGKTK